MPGAKHIDQYVEKKDKYCVRIGAWAIKHFPGIASCRCCFTIIDFAKVKGSMIGHSESNKHRAKAPSIKISTSQLTTLWKMILKIWANFEEKKKERV